MILLAATTMSVHLPTAGVVLTVLGALVAAVLKFKPDMINAQGTRIDKLYQRVDDQDDKIEELQAKVHLLERQAEEDTDERHSLKNTIILLVSVIRQLGASIVHVFTSDQISALPEPGRRHVREPESLQEYLDLTRPRTRHDD